MAFSLYQDYLQEDDPDSARRAEAQRRATRLRTTLALIEIRSEPPGAAIYVDRKELGKYGLTPATIAVPEGEHRLLVELPGHITSMLEVTAKTGQTAGVEAPLTPVFGRIALKVAPASASVRFLRNGIEVPFTLEQGRYRLPVGRYRVVATAAGHASAEARAVVAENDSAELELGLVPLPRPTGRLLVGAGKVTADVYVDGRRVAVTPATVPEVDVGEHTLEVRAGGRSVRRRFVIAEGRATYVELDLGDGSP